MWVSREGGGEVPKFFNPPHASLTSDDSLGLPAHPKAGVELGLDSHLVPSWCRGAGSTAPAPLPPPCLPLPPPMLLMLLLLVLRPRLVLRLLLLLLLPLPPLLLLLLPPLLLGRGVPIGGPTPTAMGMKMPRAIGKRQEGGRKKSLARRQRQSWTAQPWQQR